MSKVVLDCVKGSFGLYFGVVKSHNFKKMYTIVV